MAQLAFFWVSFARPFARFCGHMPAGSDPIPRAHAPLAQGFVWTALAAALSAGFGAAALLALLLGFELPLADWWLPLVQVHGFAQAFGWLGLFIMGVSLYFVPRFSGTPLRWPALQQAIWVLTGAAMLGRLTGQLWLSGEPGNGAGAGVLGLAGLAGGLAVLCYLLLLASALRRAPRHQAITQVKPFLLTALCGWLLAGALGTGAALRAALRGEALLEAPWHRLSLDLFAALVLLPVAFAFSLRTFPLYLRLAPARWPVRPFALFYLAACALDFLPPLLWPGATGLTVQGLGKALKGGALLVFVWNLDLLLRRKLPWTAEQELPSQPRRFHPPTRPGMPDYGEFGHFERLLQAAYLCLALAGLLELWNGIAALRGTDPPWVPDALRHLYLAGFGTLLLLGMAPRMIPGFVGRRRVAHPWLVDLSGGLGLAAALSRVAPVALAPFLPEAYPALATWSSYLFGVSGGLGWLAVACLALNLGATLAAPRAGEKAA
ncbi:MAG: hypothetical protein IT369_10305 [Candidatus Latescibacteria bacterium]|nr:hypothetical protein [Candidatus Latescibacterota bacterium]